MDERIRLKIEALATEYAGKLPDKIAHIKSAWLTLQENWNEDSLDAFHRELHALSGSAAIYGFETVSKTARTLEYYIHGIAEKKAVYSPAIQYDVDLLLKGFDKVAEAPERNLSDMMQGAERAVNPSAKRFYVLDRDKDFVNSLRAALATESAEVKVLSDFEAYRAAIIDKLSGAILIMDVDDLSKPEIHKITRLRQNQEAVVPLICVSKDADLLARLKSVRLGASAFFQKPFDVTLLVKALMTASEARMGEANRVLIIDDTASLAEYYALVLHQAGMCTHVITNPMSLMDAIADFQPDLLLMDIYMPTCTGLELATVLRQEPLYAELPIIFLSSEDERMKQLFAMGEVRRDEFLTKPVMPAHLVSAVRYRAKRLGSENPFLMRDSLTQLLNQQTIQENLHVELDKSQQFQRAVSLVFIDVDHFQSVNDRYGRAVGDYVLRKISEFLLSQVRKVDMVGRYEGEKFAIILPGADVVESKVIGEKLRDKFSRLQFMADGADFYVTFSVGLASYPPTHSARDMIVAADRALQRAKAGGRNSVIHAEDVSSQG